MIAVGVDSHKERHVVVVLDSLGQLLGEISIAASLAGYRELDAWVSTLDGASGELVFGIEGAGSWGAGLCEYLQAQGRIVLEVERPRRRERRAGKSDRVDALSAAKRVLAGDGTSTPRQQGVRRALAALLVAQRSATCERTRLLNALQSLHATAPLALRERVGEGPAAVPGRPRGRDARPGGRARGRTRDLAGHARPGDTLTRAGRRRAPLRARAARHHRLAGSDAARRGPRRPDLRCQAAGLRHRAVHLRSRVREVQRHGAAAGILGQDGPSPPVAWRRSPGSTTRSTRSLSAAPCTTPRLAPTSSAEISEGKTKREAMRSLKRHLSRRLFKQLVAQPLTP